MMFGNIVIGTGVMVAAGVLRGDMPVSHWGMTGGEFLLDNRIEGPGDHLGSCALAAGIDRQDLPELAGAAPAIGQAKHVPGHGRQVRAPRQLRGDDPLAQRPIPYLAVDRVHGIPPVLARSRRASAAKM